MPGRQLPHRPRPVLAARTPARLAKRPADTEPKPHRPQAPSKAAGSDPRPGAIQARAVRAGAGKRPLTRSQKPRITLGRRRAGAEKHGPAAGYPLAMDASGLSSEQQHNIVTCLTACHQERANELATLAMMCLGYGENSWHTYGCNSGGYCGVFQLGSSWQSQHAYTDVGYWAVYALKFGFYGKGGLIHLSQEFYREPPGFITNLCQGAYANPVQGGAYYDQYLPEARWALRTFGPRAGYHLSGGGVNVGTSIPGGGNTSGNVRQVVQGTDWAGNVENCWKLVLGGANEASHMSGLTRKRIGAIHSIGLPRRK